MSQLRLFLYHIYYKLKDISVLSSLRWVTLWKRQWWECVCNVMAYLLDSLTNKDIFCILQPSFSVWNHEHSIACEMSWERESTSRQRGGESPAFLAYIYFRKRSAYVKVTTCYNLLELLVCDSQVNRWLQIFVCLDQFWIRQVLGFDSLIANASALW